MGCKPILVRWEPVPDATKLGGLLSDTLALMHAAGKRVVRANQVSVILQPRAAQA